MPPIGPYGMGASLCSAWLARLVANIGNLVGGCTTMEKMRVGSDVFSYYISRLALRRRQYAAPSSLRETRRVLSAMGAMQRS